MNVAARLRYARISPQKCRLVADMVRGKPVGEALQTLQFTPKKAAGIVKKVLEFQPGLPPRVHLGNVSDFIEKKREEEAALAGLIVGLMMPFGLVVT